MKQLPTILIVDDTEVNLLLLEKLISSIEVDLITASSGFEALEKSHGIDLALAIVDVRMPGMNGYELAENLNKERNGDKVPVIFLTASHYEETDVLDGYSLGAVDFISKPVSNSILLSKVNVFVQLHNQRKIILAEAALLEKSTAELQLANTALRKSEEKYRSYIDNAPDGVFIADENGKYIEVNDAASEITGYSKEELLQMKIPDLIPEESLPKALAQFDKLVQEGSLKVDLPFKHKNGTLRWWSLAAVKLSETRFLCFVKDNTRRLLLEESLRTYQIELEMQNDELTQARSFAQDIAEKYTNLYDFAPTGYLTLARNTEILELNHSAAHMLGKDRSHLTGSHFGFFISQATFQVFAAFLQHVFDTNTRQICEVVIQTESIEPKVVHIEGVNADNGNHCLLSVIDITKRKLAEDALRESEEKFRSVTQSASDAIITTNSEGIILGWNSGAEKIFGYTESEIVGNGLDLIMPQTYAAAHHENIKRVANGGDHHVIGKTVELSGQHKLGHEFPVEVSMAEWETASGKFFTGIIRDITKRKKAEYSLKQTSTRLALATLSGRVGVWELDIVSNHLEWDDQMFALYGIDKACFSNAYQAWQESIHPDDLVRSNAEVQAAIRGEKEFDTEFRVCWPDGSVHTIRAMATIVRDNSGFPLQMVGTNWDITAQKRLEENLKSSEANFRTFFETMDDMIIVGNSQGEIIYVNNALRNKLGYTDEELHGKPVLQLNPAEMREEAEQIFAEMFAGKRDSCPLPLVRKNGLLLPVETRVWFGKWNGVDCIFGFSKDLSAEQEALQKFNKIFDSNPTLMAISSVPDSRFTDVNKSFVIKTGYSREEVIGKTAAELDLFILPEKQKVASAELGEHGIIHNKVFQIKTKSGQILEGLFSGEIIESQGKAFFLTVMVDITELKQAEDVLRESEANLAEAQRIAHIGSWEWDMIANKVKWSKEMYRVFDIAPDIYEGNPEAPIKMLHPDDVDSFNHSMDSNLSEGNSLSLEYRVIHKDGSIHNLSAEGRVEFDADGKPIRSIGTVQDITERKRVADALQKSEDRYRAVIEDLTEIVCRFSPEGVFVFVNEAWCRFFGKSKEELLGKKWYPASYSDDLENVKQKLDAMSQENSVITIENRVTSADGSLHWMQFVNRGLYDGQGKLLEIQSIGRDITKRKQTEEILTYSESSLAEAQRIAHIGSWEWNMVSDTAKWSKEMFRIFDIDPVTFDNKRESLIEVIHPDDVEHLNRVMNSQKLDGTISPFEFRVIHKDGTIHNMIAEGRVECDPSGKPIKSFGTVQDISERKRAEEDLRQANSFLDSIVENIPDMIFIKDIDSLRFVRFNKAGEELLGIPKEEMVGKTDYDFFTKELADSFVEKDRAVLQSREMLDIAEERIHTRYNGIRLLHTRKVPVLNFRGEPEYLLGISEDITELKMAEQALKVNEEKYKTLLNSSPDGVFLINLEGIITEVSEIGIELFGADNRFELVGKHILRFVPMDEKNNVRDIIEKTMNEGLAQNVELKIRKKNQSLLFSEISSTLIQDSEGVPLSFMITIRDISQRKKMETKQFHADRMANLGEMASGIAHEINQPLNIISLVMDNILYEASREENIGKEYLKKKTDKIFENIARIRNIIDHVRAFSRSNDDYILTGFDLNASIRNALAMISEQFKHLAIELNLQLDPNMPSITGNTIKFEQVVLNLLMNAKDALLEKKNELASDFEMFILVRSYQENQCLVVEVTDNGTGISKDDIEHIMLPFYTTKDAGKGTGLGLSISYQIVKEMNGTIEIADNKFNGTTFKIILKNPNNV